jgi:hypothetical protein
LVRESEEEIVMKKPNQLKFIAEVVENAKLEKIEDEYLLDLLSKILENKADILGTKVQLRPYFSKEDNTLHQMQIIVKWGGILTHGGHFHSL